MRNSSPFSLPVSRYSLDRNYHRGQGFSEVLSSWALPLETGNNIGNLAVSSHTHDASTMQYLHLTSTNPTYLFTMPLQPPSDQGLLLSDLFYCYPSTRGSWRPEFTLCPLTHPFIGQIVLFEARSQSWLWVDPISHTARWIDTPINTLASRMGVRLSEGKWKVLPSSGDNSALLYSSTAPKLYSLDFESKQVLTQRFPFCIQSLAQVGRDKWVATDGNSSYLCRKREESQVPEVVELIDVSDVNLMNSMFDKKCTENCTGTPRLLFSAPHIYAGYTNCADKPSRISFHDRETASPQLLSSIVNHQHNMILNLTVANEKGDTTLEAVDLQKYKLAKYTLSKPTPSSYSQASLQENGLADYRLTVAPGSGDIFLTDKFGYLLQVELAPTILDMALRSWRELLGEGEDREVQVSRERFSGQNVKHPKHGWVDPQNAPHVGGNTWAGGTGGRDTAGLGGKGGPYRLDAGHQVHQLSDEEKRGVPEEVNRAARDMGRKAFEERMREINMSSHDADLYQQYVSKVRQQIGALKDILSAVHSQGGERSWVRHQTTGTLDDSKLVDSISGEKNVFVRRGEEQLEIGAAETEPKRMRLLVDVSGSMYRFNSMDGRLERSMESVLMVLEAFKDFEGKVQLEVIGHSGDNSKVEFVKNRSIPSNDKERLNVLKQMLSHSQYCWSGDHTMQATERSVRELAREEGDQHFLVVLSDANFDRYAINPRKYGALLVSEPRVSAFVIFIGSLGDQAVKLKEILPPGKAYVCMNTKDIPSILKQIFASSLE